MVGNKRKSSTLLLDLYTTMTYMENNMEIPQRTKTRNTISTHLLYFYSSYKKILRFEYSFQRLKKKLQQYALIYHMFWFPFWFSSPCYLYLSTVTFSTEAFTPWSLSWEFQSNFFPNSWWKWYFDHVQWNFTILMASK